MWRRSAGWFAILVLAAFASSGFALAPASTSASTSPPVPTEPEAIAIIGTGMVGGALGTRWGQLGHPIIYGSRNPERAEVQELVSKSGARARATTPAEAARQADIIVFAVRWEGAQASAESLGDISGKIVVDPSNPLLFAGGRIEHVALPDSGAQALQRWLPGAKVVKALNAVNFRVMADAASAGGPVTIPVAADDEAAKQRVMRLVDELGLETFDAGGLANARYLEAMAVFYVEMLVQKPPRRFEYYLRPAVPAAAPAKSD